MTRAEDHPAAILIVDDSRANLLALEAVLTPLAIPVVRAESGAEALRYARDRDFVLIIMDVHMPNLDGYQTVELLRQRERSAEVPIVFLTAIYNELEHTRRGYALGAVDYLMKPFDPDILRAKVRALVSLYTRGQRVERARAAELERIKDLFFGAVGHDLRNPLNAVIVGARVILSEGDCANPSHRNAATRIERAGWRMSRLIEDILDLTRAQLADGIPLKLERTDLADVARAVIAEIHAARPDRAIELAVKGDSTGEWDPGRLGRIVSNLVGNAVQHCAGGPVRVSVAGEAAAITLAVHNGGTPISDDVLPRLFEPFLRGNTSADGLGLGLYIVRETLRAHGGTIDVTSTADDGTTFTARLPRSPSSA